MLELKNSGDKNCSYFAALEPLSCGSQSFTDLEPDHLLEWRSEQRVRWIAYEAASGYGFGKQNRRLNLSSSISCLMYALKLR